MPGVFVRSWAGFTNGRPYAGNNFFGFTVEERIKRHVIVFNRQTCLLPFVKTVGIIFDIGITKLGQRIGCQRTALVEIIINHYRGVFGRYKRVDS